MTIIEIATQSTSLLSTGDIIAIIVALISFVGVIISAIMTNNTTKKINASNKQLQEKWNQKNIDASLTASARIEWIQKVRNTTAELIALYFEALNTVDKADLLGAVIKAQEKTELLILFFGHEEKETTTQDVDLCCIANNDNKNNLIVNFLSSLAKKLYRYYENVKTEKLKNLELVRDRRYDEMQKHILDYDYEEYTDEYGISKFEQIPIVDIEYQQSLDEIDQQIDNLVKVSKDINSDLLMLRDIIRTYLKIEWNKAKKGA
jgi:hypothetical protein